MPLMEVAKSARMSEEKQAPLFAEMPDSPLPPLHLLISGAACRGGVRRYAEFTSP